MEEAGHHPEVDRRDDAMRKKPRPPEPPALADGWYWFKNFIFLKSGGYNHEWRIARVEGGKIMPLGFKPLDPTDRYFRHALWHGPIEPPPHPATVPASTRRIVRRSSGRRGTVSKHHNR